ncbi:RING finger ubiquitin ligase [Aspergillus sclerotialis]|uniref:DSC E3 ubiquitin ligase complex subunit A n=1 Tax=Aspergillus sclerotialis TaxID=2070753 RepID=A0A3A3A712_9EURO|nr:RING finger ubiquitin ligase [Aspergillus sclerotialis]
MDNRGSFFFLLVLIYLFLSSQTRPPLIEHTREHQQEILRERDALRLLNESKYGDFHPPADRWLPFPGLRKNDTFSWDLLPSAQQRARQQVKSAFRSAGLEPPTALDDADALSRLDQTQLHLPVYHNATSRLRGNWVRRPDTSSHGLNMTAISQEHEYFTHDFSLNITGGSGTFYLDIHEGGGEEFKSVDGQAREIRAALTVESDNFWGDTWFLNLLGVHFPETGGIILSSTSEKFSGLFSLPHFTLSNNSYELAHQLLVNSLSDAIPEKESHPATFFPWTSIVGSERIESPTPKCEHIVYLQQHPVMIGDYPLENLLIEQIEQELRYPMGAPIPSAPLMVMSAVVFSPDCGYILETKGVPDYPPLEALYLTGPKVEEYGKYSARLMFVLSGLFAAQITLLLRQIKEASTPSTRSRVSFYTLALMAYGDAFLLVFILLELYEAVSFLVITAVSFLAFLSVSYIGMKFMMDVWAVQAPERREQERQTNASASSARPGSLPLPATASGRPRDTGATPVILAPDQDPPDDEDIPPPNRTPTQTDVRADVGSMYARFYFILFLMVILTIWSYLWPNRIGRFYSRALGFIYLSFWTPQIYRNVMRNCRKALRWDFVIGQSFLRVLPFVYFLTVRGNVLFVRPDSTTAFAMVGWVWVQAWILASQDFLGARFFVPRGWAPPAYDYHPILRDTAGTEEDLESGGMLPIGTLRAEERDLASEPKDQDKHKPKDKKKAAFDCAICMQEMEVPVLAAAGATGGSSVADGATSLLSRRTYMVTPCRHIFHSACLESWMRLRLQCPICRESIPPV